MRNTRWLCVLMVLAAWLLAGCAENPVRWQASEAQKQAADLTVADVQALHAYTVPAGEPIRLEALLTAKTAQTYIGLPKERPTPVSPANAGMIDQAGADAAQRPTFGQAVDATIVTGQQAVQKGFDLVDALLMMAGSIAGTWGLIKGKGKIDSWRGRATDAEHDAESTFDALRQTVRAIDQAKDRLDPAAVKALKTALADAQNADTKVLVTEARQ